MCTARGTSEQNSPPSKMIDVQAVPADEGNGLLLHTTTGALFQANTVADAGACSQCTDSICCKLALLRLRCTSKICNLRSTPSYAVVLRSPWGSRSGMSIYFTNLLSFVEIICTYPRTFQEQVSLSYCSRILPTSQTEHTPPISSYGVRIVAAAGPGCIYADRLYHVQPYEPVRSKSLKRNRLLARHWVYCCGACGSTLHGASWVRRTWDMVVILV